MDSMCFPGGQDRLAPEPDLSNQWLTLRQIIPEIYSQKARLSENPIIFETAGILCTASHCTLSSEKSVDDGQLLDSIIDWYRNCLSRGFRSAIMWYLDPTPLVSLDARLYARGVSPNWEPHWMYCELAEIKGINEKSSNYTIQVKAEDDETGGLKDGCLVRKVHASRNEEWLGSCTLIVTTSGNRAAGLFDMFVQPQERKQGIGTALAVTSCELAMELGCRFVLLNSTDEGESVYRRAGFRSMGRGRTWFLDGDILSRPHPSPTQVKFLEAIGLGDMESLKNIEDEISLEHCSEETVNGETPLEIAVRCKQHASSKWLIDRGVVPDIMSLWDLGWRDRIPAMLTTHPDLVLRRSGRWKATPLHTAIERNDFEMVKLLLKGANALEVKDGVMNSTPMGWAKYFQRTEIVKLLELAKSKTL